MIRSKYFVMGLLLLGPVASGYGVPAWSEDPSAVYVLYDFPTNSKEPVPTLQLSPFGPSSASITLGAFAEEESWQDYNDPNKAFGAAGHGSWQLGQAGLIDIIVPFADAGNVPDQAVLEIEVDYYVNLGGPPTLQVNGTLYEPVSDVFAFTYTTPMGFTDFWYTRSWSIVHPDPGDEDLAISVIGDENVGTLVDRVELYAIPEPHVAVLLLIGLLCCWCKGRRSGK